MAISAATVKELREKTGAGMMDCQRALAGGQRRHRRGGQGPAQEGPRGGRQEGGSHRQGRAGGGRGDGRRARGGDGRGQLRDRLRGAHRGVPGVRQGHSRDQALAERLADLAAALQRPASLRSRAHGRAGRGGQDRARSARTSCCRASRTWAPATACRSAPTCTWAARSACWSRSPPAPTRRRSRTWPCTSRPPSRASCVRDEVPAEVINEEREIAGRRRPRRQAGAGARQDRRRQGGQVLRAGLPARAAVRQGPGADGRRHAARPRVTCPWSASSASGWARERRPRSERAGLPPRRSSSSRARC